MIKEIYTDGGCWPNDGSGAGGWGVAYKDPKNGALVTDSGGEKPSTNNRMELTAIIQAIKKNQGEPIVIYSDSRYCVDGFNTWCFGWKTRGWTKRNGEDVKNKELWQELDSLRSPLISLKWVKGHDGVELNEVADQLASKEIEKRNKDV